MKAIYRLFAGLLVILATVETNAAQIDIPLRTWVAVPLNSPQAPCLGGCKHMRLTHNPINGLIYFFGGDHDGSVSGFAQSGRQEMYTYSIEKDEWQLEQPYCRGDGLPQPSGPDEFGWIFDTKRNVFWHNPGFNWGHDAANCPGSDVRRTKIMSYDPVTKVWTDENRTVIPVTPGNARYAQYDPVEDTFVVFVKDQVYIYDIENDAWSTVTLSAGDFSAQGMAGDEYTAIDQVNRKIYLVENKRDRHIFVYNMDTKTLADLGPLPASSVGYKEAQAHWDPINNVVIWPLFAEGENPVILMLYVFHPGTNTWEEIPIAQPNGYTVKGRQSVYDPYQNVLMVMGPKGANSPVFLYRYGAGSGGVADSIAPAAPSTLNTD